MESDEDFFDVLPAVRRRPPSTNLNGELDSGNKSTISTHPSEKKKAEETFNQINYNNGDNINDDLFDDMLPVKRRGPPPTTSVNDMFPVKRRGPLPRVNDIGSDPFDNLSITNTVVAGSPKTSHTNPLGEINAPEEGNFNGVKHSNNTASDDLLPVKRGEPQTSTIPSLNNGLDQWADTFDDENVKIPVVDLPQSNSDIDGVFDLPVIKNTNANSLNNSSINNTTGEGSLIIPIVDHMDNTKQAKSDSEVNNVDLSDVHAEISNITPLKESMSLKDIEPISSNIDDSNHGLDNINFLACQHPARRKPNEFDMMLDGEKKSKNTVTFDLDDSQLDPLLTKRDSSPFASNNGILPKQDFGDDFDANFQPIKSSDFIDGLDFLEQCGEQDAEAMDRLARKSLYVRFDPLSNTAITPNTAKLIPSLDMNMNNPVKPLLSLDMDMSMNQTMTYDNKHVPETPYSNILMVDQPSTKTVESSLEKSFANINVDPFSPVKNNVIPKPDDENCQSRLQSIPNLNLNCTGLVEPLLYTQSDLNDVISKRELDFQEGARAREKELDEIAKAREIDWQKKYEVLESRIKEEVAMRELLEQDHRSKIECLRNDNTSMKQVLAQYEKTIVELTEDTQMDSEFREKSVAESERATDQLQSELNNAEANLFDAYKRIEKLKEAIDTYKQNEDKFRTSTADLQSKLQKSEEKYLKLKQHATEKVDGANAFISKLRKQQEIDSAGLNAALKKSQNRVANLELEVQQKALENNQLSEICDDLIKKVSGD